MRKSITLLQLLLIPILFLCACSKIDKDKFEKLFLIGNEIESSQKIGISYLDFNRKLQNFLSEKDLIDTDGFTKEEKSLYQLYDDLLVAYQHSHILWQLDSGDPHGNYSDFPNDYIRYEESALYDNEKIIKKLKEIYNFNVETIKYKVSGWDNYYRDHEAVNRDKAISKIWIKSSLIFSKIKKITTQ